MLKSEGKGFQILQMDQLFRILLKIIQLLTNVLKNVKSPK